MAPVPNDAVATLHQAFRTGSVGSDLLGVLRAVYLHDKPHVQTNEVHYVRADRVLSAETEPVDLPASECSPQGSFGVRHVPPEAARPVYHDGALCHWLYLSARSSALSAHRANGGNPHLASP